MSHTPSDTELTLLKLLWKDSPLSARAIHERGGADLGWSLSSTRTTLTRMVAKGLLSELRHDGVRAYAPSRSKTSVMARLMRRFVRDVLELDGPLPTSAFTGGAVLSEADLAEIEALLAEDDDSSSQTPADRPGENAP